MLDLDPVYGSAPPEGPEADPAAGGSGRSAGIQPAAARESSTRKIWEIR